MIQLHARMLTGSVSECMINVWCSVYLDWCLVCTFTLKLGILVSVVFIMIQLLFSKLLIQP